MTATPHDVTRPSPNFYRDRLGVAITGVTIHSTRGGQPEPVREFSAALNWLTQASYRGGDGKTYRNPSIHYVVGHDGRLATAVPERHGAWHAGTGTRRTGANLNAVGIELVQPRPDDPFPAPLLGRCMDLVAEICRRHGIPPLRVHTRLELPSPPADALPPAKLAARLAQLETGVADLNALLRNHRHRVRAAITDASATP